MDTNRAITETSSRLVKVLQKELMLGLKIEAEHIGLGVPGENDNLMVCIYLYDIRKNTSMMSQKMSTMGEERLRYPSTYYDLYYMIVPYSKTDVKYRSLEEQKCLDVMIQTLGDQCFLEEELFFELNTGQDRILLEIDDLGYEEKSKIWSSLNQKYKCSLFCKAGPVEVKSARSKQVKRVREVEFGILQREKGVF